MALNYPPERDPSAPLIHRDDTPTDAVDAPIRMSTAAILTATTATVVTVAGLFVSSVAVALIAGALAAFVVALAAAML